MKIGLITVWYNEEILAPLFLNHYTEFVDGMHIFLDCDTNDRTRDIITRYGYEKSIIPLKFPDGMDDTLKMNMINSAAYTFKDCYDWIIAVDADEFIFHPKMPIREYLNSSTNEIEVVWLWEVFRHITEKDINPNIKPLLQRQHGDSRIGVSYGQATYNKHMIARTNCNLTWTAGNHRIMKDNGKGHSPVGNAIVGTHWCMADVDLAIARRIRGRRDRMSRSNFDKGMTGQHWTITEEDIRKECDAHLNDVKLFDADYTYGGLITNRRV